MITVYGLLGPPGPDLRAAADAADHVVAPDRVLDALAVDDARRIRLGALSKAIQRIVELLPGRNEHVVKQTPGTNIVIVASGDPLFFGVVRTLRGHGLRPTVVTAPSSIATAFAAVGVPWDDAMVVSAHGRPLATAVNLARACPKVAVFTSPDNGIRELATALGDTPRWYVLAERLGEPDEQVRILDAATAAHTESAQPNVVLILADHPDDRGPGWGAVIAAPNWPQRPTVCDAAAVAFAALLPQPGELLWATGDLADDVAALAAWAGAAVDRDPARPRRANAPAPNAVLAPTLAALAGHTPQTVVLTQPPDAELPDDYTWTTRTVGDTTLTIGALI